MAGGAGLVPLMSMLRTVPPAPPPPRHTCSSPRARPNDVLYRDELGTLEPREGLCVAHTYTREAPPGLDGLEPPRRRRDAR